jgi:hypothetical protein
MGTNSSPVPAISESWISTLLAGEVMAAGNFLPIDPHPQHRHDSFSTPVPNFLSLGFFSLLIPNSSWTLTDPFLIRASPSPFVWIAESVLTHAAACIAEQM